MKNLFKIGLLALLLVATPASAQIVPAQNQIIPSAYFGAGVLISTSTSPTHKITAVATSTLFAPGTFAPFPFTPTTFGSTAANSTSTLIGFTQGIYALASSTIGNGTQTGGLTVSGGATTTGTAYFASQVGVGTSTPSSLFKTVVEGNVWITGINGPAGGNNTTVIGKAYTGSTGALGTNISDTFSVGTSSVVIGTGGLRAGLFNAYYEGPGSATGGIAQGINGNAVMGASTTGNLTSVTANGGPIRNRYQAVNISTGYNLALSSALSAICVVNGTLASSTSCASFHAELPTVGSGNLMTNNMGLWVRGGTPTGTLTNRYGVYIDDLVGGTNRYGFYQAGLSDLNYFNGNTGIGTTSPFARLSIGGTSNGTASLFAVSTSTASATSTAFQIDSNGRVAIGPGATVTSPHALSVTGSSYFSGNMSIGSTSPFNKFTLTAGSMFQAGGDATTAYTPATIGGVDLGVNTPTNTGGRTITTVGNTTYLVTSTAVGAGGCSVSDQTGCEFRIFDTSTSTPKFLGGIDIKDGSATDVAGGSIAVAGNYAYVTNASSAGTCSNTSNSNGCEFRIYDISNPTNPVQVGGINLPNTGRGLVVVGRYAYITTSSATTGFRVVDVGDPTNPIVTSVLNIGSISLGMFVKGNYLYLASETGAANTFQILDISNPGAPTTVSGLQLGVNAQSVYVSGNYAYVGLTTGGGNEFVIYDVSNPAAIATTSSISVGAAVNSVFVSGRYAYIGSQSVSGNELRIYDISDPFGIVTVGGADVVTNIGSVFVGGGKIFVNKTNSGITNDFVVYNATGAEFQSLIANSLEAGNAQVKNSLIVGGNAHIGSLNVAQGGISSRGPLAVYTASTTATNPISATFIGGNVGVGTTTPKAALVVESAGSVNNSYHSGSVDSFLQNTIQNRSTGTSASTNWIACNNLAALDGMCSTYYGEFGVNGSNYSQAGFSGQTPNDVYLIASDSWLDLGTASTTGPFGIRFFVGGSNAENIAGVFASSTNFGIGSTSPFAKLSVHARATDRNTTLFAIASSTATATTTLFSVNNVGTTTIGLFGACNTTRALTTDAAGNITCGSISGSGGAVGNWFTPVPLFGSTVANATSTLTGFTNGIYALASSTIGGGTPTTGLTISGGATTTGNLYVAGNVGVATTSPGSIFSIQGVANFVASAASTIYNSLRILGTLILPSLATPAGSFLAVDPNGNVIATTTPSGGGSTVTNVGTSTTTDVQYLTTSSPLSLVAGDTVNIFWTVSTSAACGTGAGSFIRAKPNYKLSTHVASTSIGTFVQGGNSNGCVISGNFPFTATTTVTLWPEVVKDDGNLGPNYVSIVAQKVH